MGEAGKKLISVLTFVAGFMAVGYAIDAYREHQVRVKAESKLERLKQDAAQHHPGVPPSVAMQQEASEMAKNELDNEPNEKKRHLKAAGNFFGFYFVNVRERADYCYGNSVDITPFVARFSQLHETELTRAREIIAGTDVSEEKIYSLIQPQLTVVIAQDMGDIARQYNLTTKDTCDLFVSNGEEIAEKMKLAVVQPAVYQALME